MKRYELEAEGKRESECPRCGWGWMRLYIDTNTGEPLEPKFVGMCTSYGIKCKYHCTPVRYFNDVPMLEMMISPPIVRNEEQLNPAFENDPQFWAELFERRRKRLAYERQQVRRKSDPKYAERERRARERRNFIKRGNGWRV